MSQEQPRQTQTEQDRDPITYGDIFNVHGNLASTPVAPVDAATMQAAENRVLGETRRGGPASAMQSAANVNLREGFVDPDEASNVARDDQIEVSESDGPGGDRVITETIAGQVVAQYIEPRAERTTPGSIANRDAVTIGEALEATSLSAGEKPVEQSDAAAIQAAEVRATGINEVLPGGIGAEAQSAATRNRALSDRDKITLSEVLEDASLKLPADKAVTREDADRVIQAEVRNRPDMHATPGGVTASMAAAARMNRNRNT
ncbi:hypothetical protein JCGZ_21908 [Jatropha curcas]|uniref:SMP domain-containing protein n=1 Tax=Jatropha curcas TaxID=180498 RepID=A0A067JCA0_JATCU|nr:late embryogenesis abundant protein D-34 [Jatropha curcas]KDP21437.1 hypothetical protein JCGZ_21908 [Jatropha curcas]